MFYWLTVHLSYSLNCCIVLDSVLTVFLYILMVNFFVVILLCIRRNSREARCIILLMVISELTPAV